jgi:hypothetical protein
MKNTILATIVAGLCSVSSAQSINITREEFGSGQPYANGTENAVKWDNNIFHAPQYMPGYPTAATLYPRVLNIPCTIVSNDALSCKGYNWVPQYGRAEYLMVQPIVKIDQKPQVITNTIIKEVPGPIRQVFVEVPVKKKAE